LSVERCAPPICSISTNLSLVTNHGFIYFSRRCGGEFRRAPQREVLPSAMFVIGARVKKIVRGFAHGRLVFLNEFTG
jgi:hypothetical protein